MNMFFKIVAPLACAMVLSGEANATIVYQSVPIASDATISPGLGIGSSWCSACAGPHQMVDYFSLGSNATINAIDFVAADYLPYNGLAGLTIGFWNVDGLGNPTTNISNQLVIPTGGAGAGANHFVLSAALTSFALASGSYAISFYAFDFAVPTYVGGDPSTGSRQYNGGQDVFTGFGITGDHIAFTLNNNTVSAVPVPAALPLLLSGLVGLGALSRKRRRQRKAA
jgi:hypothetical protein